MRHLQGYGLMARCMQVAPALAVEGLEHLPSDGARQHGGMKKLVLAAVAAGGVLLTACTSRCSNTNYTVVSKIPQPGSGTKFIATEDVSPKALVALASSACGKRWCKLLIWGNSSLAARGFPLTELEELTLIGQYIHNPSTGYERLLVKGRNTEMGSCSNAD